MKRERFPSPMPEYSAIHPNKRRFVSTPNRNGERICSRLAGRRTGTQRRHIPSLKRSRVALQDYKALLALLSLTIEDKTQVEVPGYVLLDTEDSMGISDPEPSSNTPASPNPVEAEHPTLFSLHKRIRGFYEERAKRKQKNETMHEETDPDIPMSTA
ncbi:hypothetical protein FVEN_g563 [Fusarium venenatum]|uniref:Uncharacterized protein n=1 Tax=Fusarium venenatum TaxID=56646 RepID=A0A2L2TIL5_9HYPO|nr:uncharacterized protein FVRRES_07302 [Fusarium venenatum]KAG8362274.1 hypothetical protein FVEN_g563 [Fusarium venenatum]CEI62866.1 unnamed protein product [Fusarium venenatum]